MFSLEKWSKRLRRNEQGFTLIELMVVVIIIGILVAIAVPLYGGVQARARDNACMANVRTLNGAMSMYYAEEDVFPDEVADLEEAGFIQEVPACPNEGVYSIDSDGEGGEYVVKCTCSLDPGESGEGEGEGEGD